MDPFGLSECMAYVFTFQGLVSDHRFNIQSVPLRVFWPKSKAHDHSWLGRSGKESWHLLSRLVVWFLRTHGWVVIDVLRRRNRGLVTCLMSSGSWEGLSCSLLPPDSPSDSFTGSALAQVPEICSARPLGSQSTCLEPLLPWMSCGFCGMTLGLSS